VRFVIFDVFKGSEKSKFGDFRAPRLFMMTESIVGPLMQLRSCELAYEQYES
jgi:hypothetical protein